MLFHVLDEHNAEPKNEDNTDEDIDFILSEIDNDINDFEEEEDDDPS